MSLKLVGKKILVTGAGKGIGRGIVACLVNSGAKVFALSRTKSTLDTLVQEYPDIVPVVQDLKNWDETRATLEKLEPLDGLVNNAADLKCMAPVTDFSKAELDNYFQSNLMTAINCTQTVAKRMIEEGRPGSIVNITSISSTEASYGLLGYSITKAALDMATKQCALELGPHNIRVNSVRPTFVLTDMARAVKEVDSTLYEAIMRRTTLPELPTEEDIAGPVMYLLSDLSAKVTGTIHTVDSGLNCNISTNK